MRVKTEELILMHYLSPVSSVEAQWTFAELIMGSTVEL